ncbi:GIY-YIG nuclease family protein [Bacillus sp. 03113]|uniref:GIY-YIG nuclease family protein n=1 Tax=Bacillus sp. 03113 TaxID=2578211 RepID=UPI00215BC0ED|nr:GIY-YIG nuclease family protein [Bacillus sp. 03113]
MITGKNMQLDNHYSYKDDEGGIPMDLRDKAKKLPSSPGVYLMKDSAGSIIYVGKSKHLKNRVHSYLQNSKNHSKKVEKLVKHLKDFDYIRTDTEFEAFMLECRLIKELKPIYNKLMKSPQSYTYIMIRMDKRLYRMELTNHINEYDSNLYFGPYTSKNTVEKAIKGIKEFFKMDCNNLSNKSTPCLNYSLGLCMGICFEKSAIEQYHHIINRIIALLEGTDTSILEELKQKMVDASSNVDFEKAAKVRDCIDAINSLLKKEKVIEFTKENKNIIVVECVDNLKMKLFLINRNKILFNQIYEIEPANMDLLCTLIKSNILAYFQIKFPPSPIDIRKDEIDEAQIIYRYLESKLCEYLIIPENWLYPENHDKIDIAINEFLSSILAKFKIKMKEHVIETSSCSEKD